MPQKDKHPFPASLKGYFLISESNMPDPNFYQTVVLMIDHNKDGAFGLVVNRRSHLTLGDILPKFAGQRGFGTPIYVGGPVQQEYLFCIHSELPDGKVADTSSVPVHGVFFEPSFRNLEKFFEDETWDSIPADDKPDIHLYLGYSGWAPGQLEKEMEMGSWMVHPAGPRIVFHENPEQGWKDALREKGGIYRVFADSNQDPGLN
ncbi:MAG: YqgE/AlgH family protein [Spirochaetia bacterium]|nr:YqgE/AlgH family protein [Spirochaetia bacterium]